NIAMCTDDIEHYDMFHNGQMNRVVRITIEEGVPPPLAIRFARLGGTMWYALSAQGAIAAGYIAGVYLVESLGIMHRSDVDIKGKRTVKNGEIIEDIISPVSPIQKNTVDIPELSEEDFLIRVPSGNEKVTLNTINFNDIGTTEKGEVTVEVA